MDHPRNIHTHKQKEALFILQFGCHIMASISKKLKQDLMWETWRTGKHETQDPNYCDGQTVTYPDEKSGPGKTLDIEYNEINVDTIKWEDRTSWSYGSDHSKIGITANNQTRTTWSCIGDLNRETTQDKRGGGYAFTGDENLSENFHQSFCKIHHSCD